MSDVIGFGLDRCGTWPVGIHGIEVSSAEVIPYQCSALFPSLRPTILLNTDSMDLDVRSAWWEVSYKAAPKNVSLSSPWGPGKA